MCTSKCQWTASILQRHIAWELIQQVVVFPWPTWSAAAPPTTLQAGHELAFHHISIPLLYYHQSHTHTHTTVLLLFWNMSGTTRVSRYQTGKTNLDLLEQEIVSVSGICWAICKPAPHPRQPRQHPITQQPVTAVNFTSKQWRRQDLVQWGHKSRPTLK